MLRFAIPLLAVLSCVALAQAQEPKRAVTRIKGDVYRLQNNFHFSIFVVTKDGVIVTDPINSDAAAFLQSEIAKLTNAPVTHLVYSHSHGDHASGGAEFADTAIVIAQQNAPEQIDGVRPTIRFSERMQFEHGGKTVELTSLGNGHGQDLIAIVVRPENVAFVVDAVSVNRLPFRDFPGTDVAGVIQQIKTVETLDFEILAPGHGSMGTKADATIHREYIERLMEAVKSGLKLGNTIDQLVENLDLSKYAEWGSYNQWREANIRGMASWLEKNGAL